jgi:hypothetical protein
VLGFIAEWLVGPYAAAGPLAAVAIILFERG